MLKKYCIDAGYCFITVVGDRALWIFVTNHFNIHQRSLYGLKRRGFFMQNRKLDEGYRLRLKSVLHKYRLILSYKET